VDGTIAIEEVPTSVVEFLSVTVDATGADSDDALRERLRQALRDTARDLRSDSAVIRLCLTGATPRRWQVLRDRDVWADTAAQHARETGVLWLDKLVIDLSDTAAPGHGATDELAAIMQAIRDEPGFTETCRTKIEGILQELPPQRRAALLPDEAAMDRLARDLAERGAERMLARMRGAAT